MSTHKRRLTRRRVLGAGTLGAGATGAAVAGGTGLLSTASAAGFGHSDDGRNFVVDTGASLVFKASETTGGLTSHKGEPAVHTREVRVAAGGSTALNSIALTGDPARAIRRLGNRDGAPGGFKNAEPMTHAHPSDGRAAKRTGDVTPGTGDPAASFPAYIWQDVNDGIPGPLQAPGRPGRRRAPLADRCHGRVRGRATAGIHQ